MWVGEALWDHLLKTETNLILGQQCVREQDYIAHESHSNSFLVNVTFSLSPTRPILPRAPHVHTDVFAGLHTATLFSLARAAQRLASTRSATETRRRTASLLSTEKGAI